MATDVAAVEEIQSLENEFRWVLDHEVKRCMKDLAAVLKECSSKFPASACAKVPEPEKFMLNAPSTSPGDQVKVVVTVAGDKISQADINLKLPRGSGHKDFYQNTSIREDSPWILQQVQDAANHLRSARAELEAATDARETTSDRFKTGPEVLGFLGRFMASLQRSRAALVNPKKRTLDELRNSRQVRALVPAIPPELALSFYLQGCKLILAVYHIVTDPKTSQTKFNRYQTEAVIPWANDVVVCLTAALQTAQQLKDKISIFSQFPDFTPASE